MKFFNKIAEFLTLIINASKSMVKNLFFLSFLIIILSSCKNKDGITGNQEKLENPDERARNFADKNPITLFKDSIMILVFLTILILMSEEKRNSFK